MALAAAKRGMTSTPPRPGGTDMKEAGDAHQ
jgi:hypothetical protein